MALSRRYLSLEADAPTGFEHTPAPTRRELRGGAVAVWTRDPDAFVAGLGGLREKVRGVIVCPGEAGRQTQIGRTLWRLEVSESGARALLTIADAWLRGYVRELELRDELELRELELERERTDRAILVDKLDHETRSLRDLLVARTEWTAKAAAALVSFSAEGIASVPTSQLPTSLVEFLTAEPLAFVGAGVWTLVERDWVALAEAGELGTIELPAPDQIAGIVQPRSDALVSNFEIATPAGPRACAVAVTRRGTLDDADASFLALLTAQLVALFRTRSLNEALERASAAKDVLIAELSTPIIQIWHDMVCLPIIGSVDDARASRISAELLDAVARQGIRSVIVDFTGISTLDTNTVRHFSGLARAIGLLGARCSFTGITAGMAQTLVGLGVELGGTQTLPSVRAALAVRLRQAGE